MAGLTPLEKAIVRAVMRGADTRDKIRREFKKYFDSWDIDRVVDGLLEKGVLEAYTKGLIRKSERIRVTSIGVMMERRTSVITGSSQPGGITAPSTPRSARSGSGLAAAAARGAVSAGTGHYVGRALRDLDEDDEEEDYDAGEEGQAEGESLLDRAAEGIREAADRAGEALEEAREEAEDLLDRAEDLVEELLDEEEEEREEY